MAGSGRRRLVAAALLAAAAASSAQASVGIRGHYAMGTLDGQPVTERSFPGKWQLVYFGFTTCAKVCSAVMGEVTGALNELGPLAAKLQPVFITLDPERDAPGQLRSYLSNFDARILGLRGTEAQTKEAIASFRVYSKTVPLQAGSSITTIEHSSFLFLLKPDGSLARLLQANGSGHELAGELRGALQ